MKKIINLILCSNLFMYSYVNANHINLNNFVSSENTKELSYLYDNETINKILINMNNIPTTVSTNSSPFVYHHITNLSNVYNVLKQGVTSFDEDIKIKDMLKIYNIKNDGLEKYDVVEPIKNMKNGDEGNTMDLIFQGKVSQLELLRKDLKSQGSLFRECELRDSQFQLNVNGGLSDTLEQIKKQIEDFEQKQKDIIKDNMTKMYMALNSLISDEAIAEYVIKSFVLSTSYVMCKTLPPEGIEMMTNPIGFMLGHLMKNSVNEVTDSDLKVDNKEEHEQGANKLVEVLDVFKMPIFGKIFGDMVFASKKTKKEVNSEDKDMAAEATKSSVKDDAVDACMEFVQSEMLEGINTLFSILSSTIKLRKEAMYQCNDEKLRDDFIPNGYSVYSEKDLEKTVDLSEINLMTETIFKLFNTVNSPIVKTSNYKDKIKKISQKLREQNGDKLYELYELQKTIKEGNELINELTIYIKELEKGNYKQPINYELRQIVSEVNSLFNNLDGDSKTNIKSDEIKLNMFKYILVLTSYKKYTLETISTLQFEEQKHLNELVFNKLDNEYEIASLARPSEKLKKIYKTISFEEQYNLEKYIDYLGNNLISCVNQDNLEENFLYKNNCNLLSIPKNNIKDHINDYYFYQYIGYSKKTEITNIITNYYKNIGIITNILKFKNKDYTKLDEESKKFILFLDNNEIIYEKLNQLKLENILSIFKI